VKQEEGAEVAVEILAASIVRLDESMKKALSAGLKREAIVLLLHDLSGVGKPAVRNVLSALADLRRVYTTK